MKIAVFLFSLMITTSLVACTNGAPLMSSSKNTDDVTGEAKAIPPNFAQFNDIPIPEQAVMDLKRTLVFGGQNSWSGRIVFNAPYSQGGLFDFYMAEMPKFGWQEITVVRSQMSVLTFKHGNRVATIQLDGDTSGTEVSFTVSPAGSKSLAR
ncbi:MAG: hypothetical protein IKD08_02100 [Alphaproteobacteria bacterium]|nr:hypothetical protein [Alphaproteobacteria bacterium]